MCQTTPQECKIQVFLSKLLFLTLAIYSKINIVEVQSTQNQNSSTSANTQGTSGEKEKFFFDSWAKNADSTVSITSMYTNESGELIEDTFQLTSLSIRDADCTSTMDLKSRLCAFVTTNNRAGYF